MVAIRPLTSADHELWEPLWRGYLEFYRAPLGEELSALAFERLTDAASVLHGALAIDDTGAAIGLVHWLTHPATWTRGPYCYLEDLYVDPGSRGGGAGRALIEHVRDWAERAGCAKVYWLTAETNTTAQALYNRVAERSGFIQYQLRL